MIHKNMFTPSHAAVFAVTLDAIDKVNQQRQKEIEAAVQQAERTKALVNATVEQVRSEMYANKQRLNLTPGMFRFDLKRLK